MTQLKARTVPPRFQWQLEQQGLHPLLARLYAARGIQTRSELDYELKSLLPPAQLTHAAEAAILLADLSMLSKAETERIWLPFEVWLTAAPALLPVRSNRWWLGLNVIGALLLNHFVLTNW